MLTFALASTGVASAYSWPVKPFHKPHPIRGTFGDPRFHLDAEGSLSAFHFGVDIAARDGTPVYSVEPGVVVRRHRDSVTIGRTSGHRSRGRLRIARARESFRGAYRNPLRKGALTPFNDHTVPTVAWVQLTSGGVPTNLQRVTGAIDIVASIYDIPPIAPPPPWDVARLAPASVWWDLRDSSGVVLESNLAAYFDFALPSADLYSWIYAAGTYQNKPHRPGQYIFWLAHGFDSTNLSNGNYTLDVLASDTRNNIGTATVGFTIANTSTPS